MLHVHVRNIGFEFVEIQTATFRALCRQTRPFADSFRNTIVVSIPGKPDIANTAGLIFDDIDIVIRIDSQIVGVPERRTGTLPCGHVERILAGKQFDDIARQIDREYLVLCRGRYEQ